MHFHYVWAIQLMFQCTLLLQRSHNSSHIQNIQHEKQSMQSYTTVHVLIDFFFIKLIDCDHVK